jgi:two-component system, OmpR family, sensor histidine kinase QseC
MIARPPSLQRRLLMLVIGGLTVVWSVAAALTWFDVRSQLDELLDSHLTQAAAILVVQQTREIEDGEPEHDERTVQAAHLHRYAPQVAFQVFHEGRLVLRSTKAPAEPMVPVRADFREGFRTVVREAATWRVFAAYGAERDVQVYVAEQTQSRAAIVLAVLRSMLWPMLFALPLLALAAWWAVRGGLMPMRNLTAVLAVRDAQTLTPVAVQDAPAEMLPMMNALNGLLKRVAALMDSERRFTAEAAHELRTPVAAIRAQAQVAMAEPDSARRADALKATLQGCDRASRVIDQLLALARLESSAAPVLQRVELSALARSVAAQLAPQAVNKRQALELDAAAGCEVQGDDTLLSALIRNLLDNAIRYSPAGARIKISVTPKQDGVELSVQDGGPGMAQEDLMRLGERFFRVLGSGQSGSGLGWSIIQRIAAAHHARVKIERSVELGGLAVTLQFPPRG